MFLNKTVFILGAGASWHYGYPTGEELVKKVIKKAVYLENFFEESRDRQNVHRPKLLWNGGTPSVHIKAEWEAGRALCSDLVNRLKAVDPLVIDYFLGQNEHLQEIGRFLIAWVIIECQNNYNNSGRNQNRDGMPLENDNWIRFLIHKLTTGCTESKDLFLNNVQFITFNYDVSLERGLLTGLTSIKMFEITDIRNFLSGDRVTHVYGSVNNVLSPITCPVDFGLASANAPPAYDVSYGNWQHNRQQIFDFIFDASKGLRVIDPHDKDFEADGLEAARNALDAAVCVYILGYGFDENNSQRLEMGKNLYFISSKESAPHKSVLFTNFNDSNRINKRASKLFFGNYNHFLSDSDHPAIVGDLLRDRYYFEKSTRNVYRALQDDFDDIESQFTGGSSIVH